MWYLNTTEQYEPYKHLTHTEFYNGRRLLDGFYHSEEPHHGPSTTWTGFKSIVPGRRIDFIFASDDVRQLRHGILSDSMRSEERRVGKECRCRRGGVQNRDRLGWR